LEHDFKVVILITNVAVKALKLDHSHNNELTVFTAMQLELTYTKFINGGQA